MLALWLLPLAIAAREGELYVQTDNVALVSAPRERAPRVNVLHAGWSCLPIREAANGFLRVRCDYTFGYVPKASLGTTQPPRTDPKSRPPPPPPTEPPPATRALEAALRTYDEEKIAVALADPSLSLAEPFSDGMLPLHRALRDNRLTLAKQLAGKGASFTAAGDGDTALTAALRTNDKATIDYVIEKNGAAKAQALVGTIPLHVCDEQLFDRLLKLTPKEQLDARDENGNTPLHAAAKLKHVAGMRALIARKATLGLTNDDGYDAAAVAAKEDCVPCVELMVQSGVDLSQAPKDRRSALELVQRRVDAAKLAEWIKSYAPKKLSGRGVTELAITAARACKKDALEPLLPHVPATPIGYGGTTPLIAALQCDDPWFLAALLEAGVPVDEATDPSAETALIAACNRDKPLYARIEQLLAAGADVNKPDNMGTPLFYAARRAKIAEKLAALAKNGCYADFEVYTPCSVDQEGYADNPSHDGPGCDGNCVCGTKCQRAVAKAEREREREAAAIDRQLERIEKTLPKRHYLLFHHVPAALGDRQMFYYSGEASCHPGGQQDATNWCDKPQISTLASLALPKTLDGGPITVFVKLADTSLTSPPDVVESVGVVVEDDMTAMEKRLANNTRSDSPAVERNVKFVNTCN